MITLNMDQEGQASLAKEAKKSQREPIGERVIGTVDPSTLAPEEFRRLPELLYHGSAKPVEFSRNYKREKFPNKPSQTLGDGFYAQPNRDIAVHYSRTRQAYKIARDQGEAAAHEMYDSLEPHTLEVAPYQARMFDFRTSETVGMDTLKDPQLGNGNVPAEMKGKWAGYMQQYLKSDELKKLDPLEQMRFRAYVKSLPDVARAENVTLRQLLNVDFHPSIQISSDSNPPWGNNFAHFMQGMGYDGVIYNEPGEGKALHEMKIAPTYVFYNLEKIGDYNTWHQSYNTSQGQPST